MFKEVADIKTADELNLPTPEVIYETVAAKPMEIQQELVQELGTKNTEAYLRKMTIDGLIIQLDTADVRELVRVLRVTSNSLNQLTKRVHETGSIYDEDIDDFRKSYDRLWGAAEEIMLRLAAV